MLLDWHSSLIKLLTERDGEKEREEKNCSFEITFHTHPQFVGKIGTSLLVHHKFPNCMIVNFCCLFLLLL